MSKKTATKVQKKKSVKTEQHPVTEKTADISGAISLEQELKTKNKAQLIQYAEARYAPKKPCT
jgi:hypothetical protein